MIHLINSGAIEMTLHDALLSRSDINLHETSQAASYAKGVVQQEMVRLLLKVRRVQTYI
jgi:hypothetical protein